MPRGLFSPVVFDFKQYHAAVLHLTLEVAIHPICK
jgi:hypothetical protein